MYCPTGRKSYSYVLDCPSSDCTTASNKAGQQIVKVSIVTVVKVKPWTTPEGRISFGSSWRYVDVSLNRERKCMRLRLAYFPMVASCHRRNSILFGWRKGSILPQGSQVEKAPIRPQKCQAPFLEQGWVSSSTRVEEKGSSKLCCRSSSVRLKTWCAPWP